MVHQNYQNLIEMTSNIIYIVAFGVGFKCPSKIHLNTQAPPPLLGELCNVWILNNSIHKDFWHLTFCHETFQHGHFINRTFWHMKSWALRIYWHMYISSQWMFWHQDFLAQGHFGTSNFWHHGRFSTGYFGTWRFQNMDVLSPLKPIWTFWHTVPKSPWCQNILVLKNLRGQMSLYQNVHVLVHPQSWTLHVP